jgi:hypothetical protein
MLPCHAWRRSEEVALGASHQYDAVLGGNITRYRVATASVTPMTPIVVWACYLPRSP